MCYRWSRRFLSVFLILAVLGLAAAPVLAADFTITEIGFDAATGISNASPALVVGNDSPADMPPSAFVWNSGTNQLASLGDLGGGSATVSAINDLGDAVGTSRIATFGVPHAFFYNSSIGAMENLTPNPFPGELGYLPASFGNAVNNSNQVVGSFTGALGNPDFPQQAYSWQPRLLGFSQAPLTSGDNWDPNGTSTALAINNSGTVVGVRSSPSRGITGGEAFLQDAIGNVTDLGFLGTPGSSPPSSTANAINDMDRVVGVSTTSDPAAAGGHAFLWNPINQKMADLGTLPGALSSDATSINLYGEVVGSSGGHAFIYGGPYPQMTDLNSLVPHSSGPPGSDWVLTDATGINNAGQIVGTGVIGAQSRGFLLTPVPPSPPLTLGGRAPEQPFTWTDPSTGGQVIVTPKIGSLNTSWDYTITNISYNPPGGNGLSGFTINLPGPETLPGSSGIPVVFGVTSPAGWETNCCAGSQAGSIEWDNMTGQGLLPGQSAEFSFRTFPRTVLELDLGQPGGFLAEPGTWAHTWDQTTFDPAYVFEGTNFTPGNVKPSVVDLAKGAALAVFYSLVIPFTGALSPVVAFSEVVRGVVGAAISRILLDPPDSNFQQVVAPTFLSAPTIQPGGLLTAPLADLATATLQASAQEAGFVTAARISLERALGARLAGDDASALLQMAAFDEFSSQTSSAASTSARLEAQFLAGLQDAGFPDVSITLADVTAFQTELATTGFPPEEQSLFGQAGLDAADVDALGNFYSSIDPSSVPGSLFETMSQDITMTQQVADVFSPAAPTSVPEPDTLTLLGIGFAGLLAARRRVGKHLNVLSLPCPASDDDDGNCQNQDQKEPSP